MIVDHSKCLQENAAVYDFLFVYDYIFFFFVNKSKLSFDKKISATVVVGLPGMHGCHNTQVFVLRRVCRCSLVTSFDNVYRGSERERNKKRTYSHFECLKFQCIANNINMIKYDKTFSPSVRYDDDNNNL